MFLEIALGTVLVTSAVWCHATVLDLVASRALSIVRSHGYPLAKWLRNTLLCTAALAAFLSHVVQIWLWAVVYVIIGEFVDLESALYFSAVVFTTVGFGDIIPSDEWRLLAAIEGASGIFLFGLSTAFLFRVMQAVWQQGPASR